MKKYMLCSHKLKDFARWKNLFDSHADRHRAAGMKLAKMWREIGAPNNIFFMLEIADIEKANAFINATGNDKIAEQAGIIEGAMHYVEEWNDA
jgi:hypothetical protein